MRWNEKKDVQKFLVGIANFNIIRIILSLNLCIKLYSWGQM